MQKITKNVSKVRSGEKMDVTIEFLVKIIYSHYRIIKKRLDYPLSRASGPRPFRKSMFRCGPGLRRNTDLLLVLWKSYMKIIYDLHKWKSYMQHKNKSKSTFRGRPWPPRNIDLRKGRGPEARDIGSAKNYTCSCIFKHLFIIFKHV